MSDFLSELNELEQRENNVKKLLFQEQKLHAQAREELQLVTNKLKLAEHEKSEGGIALKTAQVSAKKMRIFFFFFFARQNAFAQTQVSILSKQYEQLQVDLKNQKSETEKMRVACDHEVQRTKQMRKELIAQVDDINSRWRTVHNFATPDDDALEAWANKVERANQLYERVLNETLNAKLSDAKLVADLIETFGVRLLQAVDESNKAEQQPAQPVDDDD